MASLQSLVIPSTIRTGLNPVFVLGFWRSGTTLLHELLSVDDRYCYPSTYDCMNAHKFVLTSPFARFRNRKTTRRAQDGMKMGWSTPQEDEFALLSLGARSPYEGLLAPKSYGQALALADPDELPTAERRLWERLFMQFLRGLALINRGKPVLLKSPAHGYRLRAIRRLLPDAKFIVIVRNPHEVFASWVGTYRSFTNRFGLGEALSDSEVREITLSERLRYEEKMICGLQGVPHGSLVYVRYEDLVADPVAAIRAVYRELGLPDFEYVRPRLIEELGRRSGYEKRKWIPDAYWKRRVERAWRTLFERYGYSFGEQASAPATSVAHTSVSGEHDVTFAGKRAHTV
jgi:hypothetical protein